ncbi:S-locus glycoprotein domain-containing protein [Artemisia annua]|uniref:Receptor-like serine/threonine-protein kinase n=1 Tax=Artemisia annua TaxID=35608 RepID=A0A2U1PYJ9_ARTAN|nr:S-locus glycoprotein domain-containing protein [Artemisia annua]
MMALFLLSFLMFFLARANGGSDHLIGFGSTLVAGAQSPDAWYSTSNLFAFGFYPQGTGYVVAIWLVISEEKTVVWTADRNHPPVSPNATLKLTRKGEFVLSCEDGVANKTIAVNVSFAVMKNNGNFILFNDSMDVVWQSFDYPTDSLLQGQSLLAGCQLVSSVSKTNYSSGRFRIKMQMDGNLVMYPVNTEEVRINSYSASDTNIPGISNNYLYLGHTGLMLINGSNISDTIKNLYTYPAYPVLYRATLGEDGIFRLYFYNHTNSPPSIVWKTPDHPCDVKNFCGFNSYCTMDDERPYCVCLPGSDFINLDQKYSGCERNFTKAWCKSGKENVTYYNMVAKEQLVWDDHPFDRASIDNKDDCSNSCLEDCDCDAALLKDGFCDKHKYPLRYIKRASDDMESTGFFKKGNVSLDIYGNKSLNASSPEAPQRVMVVTTSKKTWVLILIISIGFSIYLCISLSLSGFYIFKYRLLKYKRLLESRTLGLAEDLILRSYTYNDLKRATSGFKQELGRGSFGTVYKGSLYKGKKSIAVKRLEKVVDEGEKEFRAEMQVIGKTHHKNLVRLLGYCAEGKSERLLVYEYMSNGTLADRLFKSERLPDWSERVQIALDVARGILYLHEECETPIIHCDIKPQNILMDDFWTAKISDFGLAKLLNPEQTKTFTMVRGTRGYLAPEWQKNNPISVKVDIFSYGIVLLEIICCRRNMEYQVSNTEEIVLSTWVYNCFERGQLNLLVNHEEAEKETLERLVKVGLWCIQDEPALRPSMKCVLLMLEGITDIATPPCPTSS